MLPPHPQYLPSESRRKAEPHWEDPDGFVHNLTGFMYDHTGCGAWIYYLPGVRTAAPVTCRTCLEAVGEATETAPPPVLRREAGVFVFAWPFRTTGGIFHGVPIEPWKNSHAYRNTEQAAFNYETFCGISVETKLRKGTGRWTHGREAVTCIGCMAVMHA